mgnify:CR=1 FL=1
MPTLDSYEKRELYKILRSFNIPFTKNRNGIFLNLFYVEDKMIEKLYKYCKFYKTSKKLTED